MPDESSLSYLTLPEALQDIFVRQRSGALSVTVAGERQRLLFFSGQLYLSGGNPLHQRMQALLVGPVAGAENPRFDPRVHIDRGLPPLVRQLGEQMGDWDAQDLRFEGLLGETPDDLVGPVPTGPLVMDLCTRRLRQSQLLDRLGGLDSRYRASEELMLRRRVPELDRDEMRLLDRLEQAADIRTLLAEAGDETSSVAFHLARLEAVRLVVSEKDPESRKTPLSAELLSDISRRVVASLEEDPLEMGESTHRARLDKLLQEYGRQNHFELLAVDAGSMVEEIHTSFMKLARIAHPSHADRLRMKGRGRQLEWLFSRLTEAYFVLADPDRLAQYRRGLANEPSPKVKLPRQKARRTEQARLARTSYQLAAEHVETGDYHAAIELLRQAVLADPLPEYYLLLGRCQQRNPRWLHMAVDSFRAAVALRPNDGDIRRELSEATQAYRRQMKEVDASPPSGSEPARTKLGLAGELVRRIKDAGDTSPKR